MSEPRGNTIVIGAMVALILVMVGLIGSEVFMRRPKSAPAQPAVETPNVEREKAPAKPAPKKPAEEERGWSDERHNG